MGQIMRLQIKQIVFHVFATKIVKTIEIYKSFTRHTFCMTNLLHDIPMYLTFKIYNFNKVLTTIYEYATF